MRIQILLLFPHSNTVNKNVLLFFLLQMVNREFPFRSILSGGYFVFLCLLLMSVHFHSLLKNNLRYGMEFKFPAQLLIKKIFSNNNQELPVTMAFFDHISPKGGCCQPGTRGGRSDQLDRLTGLFFCFFCPLVDAEREHTLTSGQEGRLVGPHSGQLTAADPCLLTAAPKRQRCPGMNGRSSHVVTGTI